MGLLGTSRSSQNPSRGGIAIDHHKHLPKLLLIFTLNFLAAVESMAGPLPPMGVVVEEVGKHSATEAAGLKTGDVILFWERLSPPPKRKVWKAEALPTIPLIGCGWR